MSIIGNAASAAGRLSADLRGSVRRAREVGEMRVLERRHHAALAALGARALELAREGRIPAHAMADEIAEVDARLADMALARDARADEPAADRRHDAAAAFPMLADDATA